MKKNTIQNINFDSVFLPSAAGKPARLELLLKLGLLPYDPEKGQNQAGIPIGHKLARSTAEITYKKVRDANGDKFNCQTWPVAPFNAFRIKMKQVVEGVWNNQIVLVPPTGRSAGDDLLSEPTLNEMRIPSSAWPFVECTLRLTFWDPLAESSMQGKAPHGKMFVVLLDRKDMGGQGQTLHDSQPFRARMQLICNEDADPRDSRMERDGKFFTRTQTKAAHEVGHWLGQPAPEGDANRVFLHIDEGKCNQQLYDDCAYGSTKERTQSIMGAGNRALLHDAEPWLLRIREHSGALKGWTFIHRDKLKTYLQSGKMA